MLLFLPFSLLYFHAFLHVLRRSPANVCCSGIVKNSLKEKDSQICIKNLRQRKIMSIFLPKESIPNNCQLGLWANDTIITYKCFHPTRKIRFYGPKLHWSIQTGAMHWLKHLFNEIYKARWPFTKTNYILDVIYTLR